MALHGDLSSYPLPELLQWLDTSRKTGALALQWDAGERKVFVLGGQIIAVASPAQWERLARALEQGGITSGERVLAMLRNSRGKSNEQHELAPEVEVMLRELATQELYGQLADLTLAQQGRFHWSEDPDRGADEWLNVSVPLRHALFETLRWVDEGPDVDRALPVDTVTVASKQLQTIGLPVVHRMVLHAATAHGPLNLGRLRLMLGLTRGVLVRAVYELWRAGKVQVEGGQLQPDPIADMLEKGAILLRERQFEAAGLVFSALMHSDPSDRRVREFARMVEREHVAALYRELPPTTVLEPVPHAESLAALRPEERQLADLVNSRWDVSAIVLAAQLRELDALRILLKLQRLGLVRPLGS